LCTARAASGPDPGLGRYPLAAWSRYAKEIVRHTPEANQALLRAGTFKEVLEAQGKLLRGTMQSFREQTAKIAVTATRVATRPHDALKEASVGQIGD
jgi:hypothetical protein